MSWRSFSAWVVLCTVAVCLIEPASRRGDPAPARSGSPDLAAFESLGVRWPVGPHSEPGSRAELGFGPIGDAGASSLLDRALHELAEGRFDRAIHGLRRALAARPESEPTAKALSAALIARGLGGSAERPEDLVEALDRIGLEPADLPSLFNRALVLEALFCYRMAARTWELYLDRDIGSEWATRAAERLEAVREVIEKLDRGLVEPEAAPWKAALEAAESTSPEQAATLRTLRDGLAALDSYEIDEAEIALKLSLPELVKNMSPLRWWAEEGLARVEYQRDLHVAAEHRALIVLAEARRRGDSALEDRALWTLANLNLGRMRLGSARLYAERRLDLARSPRSLALAHYTLSRVLDEMGDSSRAWTHRMTSFRLLADLGAGSDLALALQNSSFALARQGLHRPAADFVSEMLVIDRASESPLGMTESFWMRAVQLLRAGETEAARADLREAAVALARIEDEDRRAYLASKIGILEGGMLAREDPRAAVDRFSRSLESLGTTQGEYGRVEILLERAKAFRQLDRLDEAADDLEWAVRLVGRQRSEIGEPVLRATFFDLYSEIADEAVEVAADRGRWSEAFRLAESMKGILLREIVGSRSAGSTEAEVPARGWHPVVRAGDILVSYWSLPEELLVWVVRAGEAPEMHRLPIGRNRLAELRDRFGHGPSSGRAFEALAAQARRRLFGPLAEEIESAQRLVVVPDRFTRGLPWSGLGDRAVRLRPTAIGLDAPEENRDAAVMTGRLLAVGDPWTGGGHPPLLAAREEVAEAARRFRNSELLIGREATRHRVLAELPRADVIQIASHFTAGAEPWSTQILLAEESVESGGDVGVREIAALDLRRARLVVLSGCATGREGRSTLEGTFAAAGAFLAAGAREVVFTLWPVDDRVSRDLMNELYDGLERGEPTDEALRGAQGAVARRYPESADWAAYQVIALGAAN